MDQSKKRLNDLLDYVHHIGQLDQKPIFRLEEYNQPILWEHQLKGKIGISHNISSWLRIERLKRIAPPAIVPDLMEWISVSNDPSTEPVVSLTIIKTLTEIEANDLVYAGIVVDVSDTLKDDDLKDVVFRIENHPDISALADDYLDKWSVWSEEEKPRRETIKIYDTLFSLQQSVEGDEQPLELIWWIGISRWHCEKHKIDIPLIEKAVEIDVDAKDGSINIYPRNIEPSLAINPYLAMENTGVDSLLRFSKKHFSELSEDVEFSAFKEVDA